MSHFAKVENGIVTKLLVSEKDFINSGIVGDEFLWVQTSYNDNFRGKFAAVGDTWDGEVFRTPSPFPSWEWDSESKEWVSPAPRPDNQPILWNEETTSWVEVNVN